MVIRPVRRTLSDHEKKSYISAVKCLQAKSPRTSSYFSGARTRYDDFVAAHINATDYVHFVVCTSFRSHNAGC
ncbi:hypothetical protein SLS55_005332 [Diplodia seriata]|uniref:Uncharacterized protein n=1 Tax=Diplodia seriata TaxID=420778 RepID=A0ABR3CG46_9PEZI